MAKKFQAIYGGTVHRMKKMQAIYGGVVHNAKSAWAVVNGVWKKVYTSYKPVTFSFGTYAYQSIAVNSYCDLFTHWAGFDGNGNPAMSIACTNATGYSGAEPAAYIRLDFDAAYMQGKTLQVQFTKDFDNDKDYNYMWWTYGDDSYDSLVGYISSVDGERTFTYSVDPGISHIAFHIRVGGDGNNGAYITITSVTVDGVEVLH